MSELIEELELQSLLKKWESTNGVYVQDILREAIQKQLSHTLSRVPSVEWFRSRFGCTHSEAVKGREELIEQIRGKG